MALIRLSVSRVSPTVFPASYVDEQGQVLPLLRLRLRVQILIGPDPERQAGEGPPAYDPENDRRLSFPAILDTGAPLTVFPRSIWEQFENDITRLSLDQAEVSGREVNRRTPRGVVAGRQYAYFLGRVWVGAYDLWGRRMPAIPILGQFREDDIPPGEPQPPLLLGLHEGIFQDRRLERNPTFEGRDPDPPYDQTFGQFWYLRD